MPMSNAERQKKYRESKIKEIGIEEYKKQNREKARARRQKAKAQAEAVDPNDPLVAQVVQAIKEMKISMKDCPEFKQRPVKETIDEIKKNVEKFTMDQSCEDTINELIAYCDKVNDRVKPKTIRGYFSKLKTLYNRMTGDVWDGKSFDWLVDTDKVLEFIAGHDRWRAVSKWGYVNAITSILSRVAGYEDAYKIYSDANRQGLAKYLEYREDNVLTEEQRANILPWDQILKLKPPDDIKEIVLFELVRWIPRRSGTYRILKWRSTHSDGENYFLITEGAPIKMVLNRYKTDTTYGTYKIDVPDKLGKLIKQYISDIPEGGYLFGEKSQGSFSSMITDLMAKLTDGKRMGTTLLRISYATWAVNHYKSVKQQKIIAQNLGHSVSQLRLYSKIDL